MTPRGKITEVKDKKDLLPMMIRSKTFVTFLEKLSCLKFMCSKKATKIDEIFSIDLTVCSKCQIDSEDFVNFLVAFLENMNFKSFESQAHYTE